MQLCFFHVFRSTSFDKKNINLLLFYILFLLIRWVFSMLLVILKSHNVMLSVSDISDISDLIKICHESKSLKTKENSEF